MILIFHSSEKKRQTRLAEKYNSSRLEGLDLARFVAFVGMVFVNFKIAMGASDDGGMLGVLTQALQGRAAATFVVLAGIGLGITALRSDHVTTVWVTLKRAVFLLVIGLLNSLVFDADILHYYAFYFLFGVMLLPFRSRWLVTAAMLLNVVFVAMILGLDYDSGWNWENYTYTDFWTPIGFVRNLFFNGWHPVVPWLGFLLLGIVLSRISISEVRTQSRMVLLGAAMLVGAELASDQISGLLATIDSELEVLATTEPVPPMPLYMLAGSGTAMLVIGLCLRFSGWLERIGVLAILTPAGRQTLTLYIAHIFIGMGTLEALQMLGGQTLVSAVSAAAIFCIIAVVYALVWSRFFKRGPIETAMRKIAG